MLQLGRLPQTADHCDWEGWRLEVVDMDGTRIDKVLAAPVSHNADRDNSDQDKPLGRKLTFTLNDLYH